MKKMPVILGLAAIAAVCGAAFVYMNKKNSVDTGVSVEAVLVSKKTIESSVMTKGNVQLRKMETIAAEALAKILSVKVKVGDNVKKGDVLIEYDPKSKENLEESLLSAELALRSAELTLESASLPASKREIASAEAEVSQRQKIIDDAILALERTDITIEGILDSIAIAGKDYANKSKLYSSGAISKAELESAEAGIAELELSLRNSRKSRESLELEYSAALKAKSAAELALGFIKNKSSEPSVQNQVAMAEVSVEQQKLKISQIKKQLDEFKLVEASPIDGSVITVSVENGYVTQAGDRLISLGDTSQLVIVTEVVEYDVPNIKPGQSVELTGEALRDTKLAGKVVSIAPSAAPKQIGNATGNVVKVEIELVDKNTVLKPGFSVSAKILTEAYENATVVPLLSLVYDKEGEYSVFIIKDDNTLEKRRVSVINFAALDAVVEGVSEGERIVASPSLDLEEGTLVNVNDTIPDSKR